MKVKVLIGIIGLFLINTCASDLEKQRLDFDKERLKFDREKFEFERQKFECEKKRWGGCVPAAPVTIKTETRETDLITDDCNCNIPNVPEKKTLLIVPSNCEKIVPPTRDDIWALSIEGGWSYSPVKINNNDVCKDDYKESFYKQFTNTESYVAEKQVPKTKKSSCINNVLFSGKTRLYDLMISRTMREELSDGEAGKVDKGEITKHVVEYNNSGQLLSFYYECKPTDAKAIWDRCACVLYASYPKGKIGLAAKMKGKN